MESAKDFPGLDSDNLAVTKSIYYTFIDFIEQKFVG
jgi:hypothetical protein